MQETQVRFLGQEDPLEKEMATHFTSLAWRAPRTEEPGGLQSMGSQRVGHNWATEHTVVKILKYINTFIMRGSTSHCFVSHLHLGCPLSLSWYLWRLAPEIYTYLDTELYTQLVGDWGPLRPFGASGWIIPKASSASDSGQLGEGQGEGSER